MDKHYGQIVELVVRKKQFSISELARLTDMNRRSVYNWFNQKYLKQDVIKRIGIIIDHDFSVEFPELFRPSDFNKVKINDNHDDLFFWEAPNTAALKDKYIELLEKYNSLLTSKIEKER
ncbi:hypothetical protein [Mucilaginibacter celer]|uniref:Uncharacterized protein n=1 Tax=Mucilaginibacter celer TaxID=2305508 RepID=A0A494VVC4_9SPHI|nr:hypothetical protein [Mucilaginibacter celer]AYL95248.1 hypothetical protein HYN43_008055 [Mucilaginibacter celer]